MSIKRVLPYAPAPVVTAEETDGSTLPPQCSEAVMAREEGRRRSSLFQDCPAQIYLRGPGE